MNCSATTLSDTTYLTLQGTVPVKPDLYTKAVLTVIASCLVYFVAQDMTPIKEAHAQSGGVIDVNIVKIDGTPVRYSSAALPVKIAK